jgi:hypothetical protein
VWTLLLRWTGRQDNVDYGNVDQGNVEGIGLLTCLTQQLTRYEAGSGVGARAAAFAGNRPLSRLTPSD